MKRSAETCSQKTAMRIINADNDCDNNDSTQRNRQNSLRSGNSRMTQQKGNMPKVGMFYGTNKGRMPDVQKAMFNDVRNRRSEDKIDVTGSTDEEQC